VRTMIRSIFVTAATFAYILIVGTPIVLYAVFTGNTDPVYQVGVAGARMALWLAGIRLEVRGKEKIPANRAVVFMPNHQSNCDPPAVITVLPPVLVLAKQEFFRVPVLGRAMRMRGFVPVDRKNRERAIQAVERAVESLKAGYSFLAYPEGTRSPDGRLQSFKKGVFMMALKAGAPIVPVSISGSNKIMRKGEIRLHPGTVRITIHDPVMTEGCSVADRARIMEAVRKEILAGLAPEEWPVEESGRRN
jgi:1-acyl-sn-glycerol-3-phosphate acyltransferase